MGERNVRYDLTPGWGESYQWKMERRTGTGLKKRSTPVSNFVLGRTPVTPRLYSVEKKSNKDSRAYIPWCPRRRHIICNDTCLGESK
ncbi:hypothetical protein TNCV_4276501 [Trichonephila clavipes]|nr:hypothetical protein TNCV_4276501 [Trichonephila clavipes]